jgi:branched-chain amino acid transport system substrate-binding protein
MRRRSVLALLGVASLSISTANAQAPAAPAEIKIGHPYAGSGPYASISMPVYLGLKLWVDRVNADGGAFVKPFNKKIPLKLIAYDDQSSTATAATLVNQLITQDKVDMLVSDSGSVLTSVAVPIAREHKQLLFNPTGTGAAFFTKDNPYIALLADPASTVWPKYISEFLGASAKSNGIKRVAILYATNDFTGTQATTIRNYVKAHADTGLEIVYDQGIPTATSNYTVIINNIAAANPDAVLALGYVGNDIAFLRNLQDSGQKFPFLFMLYPGIEKEEVLKNVGGAGLDGVFTYVTSNEIEYKPNFGMTAQEYKDAWHKTYPDGKYEFGFNAIAGYTVGLVLERTLATTESMDQLALRSAVHGLSGKLTTLDGSFELDPETGAQLGEITPVGQLRADGRVDVVWPPELATGKPVFGKK